MAPGLALAYLIIFLDQPPSLLSLVLQVISLSCLNEQYFPPPAKMNELSSMRETASDEDGYELTPLLGDGDEDDNISIQSSEPDAPLGSDHGDVESPGLGLIFLITLFSKSWFWRRLILVAASVSSIVASGLIINCLVRFGFN